MKKILVIDAHPRADSLVAALAQTYAEAAAQAGAHVEILPLRNLNIDYARDPQGSYPIEIDIARAQAALQRADHLVFAFPVFWGLFPAVLKGFIDRVFLPGFAYDYIEGKPLPRQYFKGKTARLLYTMDAPKLFHRLWYRACAENALSRATLWYTGVKTTGRTSFHDVRHSTPEKRQTWLQTTRKAAAKDANKPKLPNPAQTHPA